jgi:predicted PurR-regulated permease PerM
MGSLSPIELKAVVTCIIVLLAVMVVIFVVLLDHQRKMAEIIRSDRKQGDGVNERVDALQNQVRELQSRLASQTTTQTTDDLERRLG